MNTIKNFFKTLSCKKSNTICVTNETTPRTLRVRVYFPGVVTITVNAQTTVDLYDVIRYHAHLLPQNRFTSVERLVKMFNLVYNGKPLSHRQISLECYNMHDDVIVTVQYNGCLGGAILLPTYTHIQECEQQLLNEIQVQSLDFSNNLATLMSAMSELKKMVGTSIDHIYWIKLLEDVALMTHAIINSKNKADYAIALITFVKLRTDGPLFSNSNLSLLTSRFQQLFDEPEVQSFDVDFTLIRDYLDKYEDIRNAPIFTKLYKFGMYALSLSIFEKMGVTFSACNYSKLEAEAIKRKFVLGPDFIHCLLDTIVFLCERGAQCMKTGSLDPLYHSQTSYQDWFDKCMELKRQSNFLNFPEPHGIGTHEFIMEVRDQIDKGDSIYKHASKLSNMDKKLVGGVLNDMKMLLANETTKRAAQKERKAPFSVLLYGGSSIGKSTLTSMLFYQYGKVFNLRTASEYKYTRNAIDPFWSGFNSSQWCVILDDIAFMNPGTAPQGDPTVMEMLQVVNNVPFVPNQAELSDKGRTPMRAELVIATTNCEDINAFHYFQTPLAARRRLPYVIDVKVKPECAKDECMLDATKVQTIDGQWPNYWQYHVKRVIPQGTSRKGQGAKLETVKIFEETNEFLAWFSQSAKNHESVQTKVSGADENMSNISICSECYYPTPECICINVQATDIEEQIKPTWFEFLKYYVVWAFISLMRSEVGSCLIPYVFRTQLTTRWLEHCVVAEADRMFYLRAYFGQLGSRVEKSILCNKVFLDIVKQLLSFYISFKATGWFMRKFVLPQTPVIQTDRVSETKGQMPSVVADEKPNVWYKDEFELSTFNVQPLSSSWSKFGESAICEKIARQSVYLLSTYEGRGCSRPIRATCLSGQIYVCNNHGLPTTQTLTTTIISTTNTGGINTNISVTISQCDIMRIPDRDLAFVRIRNIPPRANITGLLPATPVRGVYKGHYIGRTSQGEVYTNAIHNVKPEHVDVEGSGVNYHREAFCGLTTTTTIVGDCGSIFLATTPRGPMLLGIHFGGFSGSNKVAMSPFSVLDYNNVVQYFAEPIISSTEPVLSAPSAPIEVIALNERSPFRYIEEGVANVYGSIKGFRQAPKTNVQSTLIEESMNVRGYATQHGPPIMKGWKPWRIAALDMVKPVVKIDNGLLAECVKAYTNDILAGLSAESLKEIMVYDNFTAVNGACGVAYVDKMNRNTSMGFPWRKGKKNFMNFLPEQHGMSDAVEFTPEIMDRVDAIILKYESGERCMPVFTGHLKDEATKFSKIESGKTRVFCGGPGDWSIVVRKYLLSFIRVLQKNRFLFEAAPGTNAQSLEWEEIRSYLTQHGEKNMIAGDYAAFDKSMSSVMILAAFDIISNVCEAAGYSPDQLKVVRGIATDTAFPLVDFKGDLVEFFGSNPSGHPLTVIVNSLANSLYMRYCYRVLNPAQEVKSFKQNVALMTYGDDNVMGVNSKTPWFNHTSLQDTLSAVGIKYTMADKEAESVPYIHMDEISFLKRLWRYDEDVDAYLCPLEEASIVKSLTQCVASKTIPAERQIVDIMSSACREYFFYGRTIFEEKRAMLLEIIEENNLQFYVEHNTFPQWHELKETFYKNSAHLSKPSQ